MRQRSFGVASVALVLLIIGCTGPAGPRQATDGGADVQQAGIPKRVTIAINGEPYTLSQTINSAGVGSVPGVSELEPLIQVGLGEVDEGEVVGPILAEAIPSTDNGLWKVFADGRMETTWKIRQGASWHDGTPITSGDLLFTATVEQDAEVPLLNNKAYKFVESIDAPDARTVTVTWKRPFIQADAMFSTFGVPLPKHLLERAYLGDKGSFTELPYWTTEFVGTGPFRVQEFVQSSHVILRTFDQYLLGRPKIDVIEAKFFQDPNVTIANVLAGEVDMTLGRGIAFQQALEAQRQWPEGKADTRAGNWIALYPQFLNPTPAVIADVRFRRALLHAVDRQQLVDSLMDGKSWVAHSWAAPTDPGYKAFEQSIIRYEYQPATAARMIEGLEYRKGADGTFVDTANQPLKLEVRTTAGDDLRNKLLFAVADSWKAAGVPTETVVIPRQRSSDREYRATRPGFEISRQPNRLVESDLERLHSSEAALPENNFGKKNRARYMNPEYDALVDRYVVTIPEQARMEIARQIVRHVSEQLPAMGLLYDVRAMLVSTRLINVAILTEGRNAHEWDIR